MLAFMIMHALMVPRVMKSVADVRPDSVQMWMVMIDVMEQISAGVEVNWVPSLVSVS